MRRCRPPHEPRGHCRRCARHGPGTHDLVLPPPRAGVACAPPRRPHAHRDARRSSARQHRPTIALYGSDGHNQCVFYFLRAGGGRGLEGAELRRYDFQNGLLSATMNHGTEGAETILGGDPKRVKQTF